MALLSNMILIVLNISALNSEYLFEFTINYQFVNHYCIHPLFSFRCWLLCAVKKKALLRKFFRKGSLCLSDYVFISLSCFNDKSADKF